MRTPIIESLTILILLLLPVCALHSQQLTFYHLPISDANNYVRTIYQDKTGYLWLASPNGLFRYDGYNILTVTPKDESQQKLFPDYHVTAMQPLKDNDLWLRLRGNALSLFDIQSELFVDYNNISPRPVNPVFSKSRKLKNGNIAVKDNRGNNVIFDANGKDVWYKIGRKTYHFGGIYSAEMSKSNDSGRFFFVSTADGLLWVSTYGNGLFAYDTHKGKLHHYLSSDKDSPIRTDYLISLYEDRAGNLWVSEEDYGLTCITKNKPLGSYLYMTDSEDHSHVNVIRLLKNVGNKLYVGNRNMDFKVLTPSQPKLSSVADYGDDVLDVEAAKDGTLWIGTRKSGIIVGNRRYVHNAADQSSISGGKFSDIVLDHKGRAWISFFNGGVDLAVRKADGTYAFRHFFTGKNKVMQPRQMIVDHSGNIWLCSNDGVYNFNPDKLIHNASAFKHYNIVGGNRLADECHCIFESSRHKIFVGTIGNGLAEVDNTGKGVAIKYYTTADGLSYNNVESLAEDANGNIWIGTDRGLSCLSAADNTIRSYVMDTDPLGNIFTESTATRLSNGDIAMGTRHGFVIFNPKKITPVKPAFNLAISDMDVNGFPIRSVIENDDMPFGIALTKELTLDHNQNSLTFHFSDFDFGNANTTMYSYKLEGYDRDWSPLSATNSAQYKNLPFGTYTMHVKARNGSGEWNSHEVTLKIRIRPPFWLSWWAITFYILLFAAIVYFLYRNAKEKLLLRQKVEVERKLTEYKLVFFTNISHEFRTPLTLIQGAMDRIDSIGSVPGSLKEPLVNMRRSVDRMLRLINQLLEFRKMQNNKLHLALEETDIVGFVRDIFYMFSDAAANKNINYTFLPFENSHMMYVDKGFIDKIMYNIISNAFKYTPQGREITVRIRQKDRNILLVVEDSGIGIAEDKRKNLFTRYDQSSYSHDSMGIGLHLTAELVRVHHGEISYEPKPGGGSIFTVAIPDHSDVYNADDFLVKGNVLLQDENKREEESRQKSIETNYKSVSAGPMNSNNVLVVEDDNDVSAYLQNELGLYFNVTLASNGLEALNTLKDSGKHFDLVVSDVRMPVMNGFELTKAIRADKQLADMPVILLTAFTAEEKQVKGINAGADAYIEKPFSMPVLLAKMKQLIQQREQLRHAYAKEVVTTHEAPTIITEEQDAKLRDKLDTWLSDHLTDEKLNIDDFAKSMGYGRTTFYRKVKDLVGMTPNEYIKQLRMQKAAELLKDDTLTIAQVSYQVGIADSYYFSKVFKSYYGKTPSDYRKGN